MLEPEYQERTRRGERGLAARRRAREVRRFYVLTFASLLIPGLGLIRSRRRLGIAIVTSFVVGTLGLLIYALTKGVTRSVLEVGLSRSALAWLIPLILLSCAIWITGIVLTARDNMPRTAKGAPRVAMVVFASIACLLVFAPAAQSARYAVIQRGLINDVFTSVRPSGAVGPTAGNDPWAGTERVNVLLIGSDAGPDRIGIRPDSVMVASINTQTGDTVLFGIPRNLQNIPFSPENPISKLWPNGYNCGSECLMEYVWTLGSENANLFPKGEEPGLVVTKDAVSQILGLKVDYTTIVDLKGFRALVDAMGGVEVNVHERLCIGCKVENGQVVGTTGYIEPGRQRLDGYHALWYARSRADSADGDFSRMRRQRCMVGALVNQVDPINMLARYPALAKVLQENVDVDIPQQDLQAWATLVLRIQDEGSIKSLPLTNKVVDVTNPDYDAIHKKIQAAIKPKAKKTPTKTSTPSPTTSTTPSQPSPTTHDDELSDIATTC